MATHWEPAANCAGRAGTAGRPRSPGQGRPLQTAVQVTGGFPVPRHCPSPRQQLARRWPGRTAASSDPGNCASVSLLNLSEPFDLALSPCRLQCLSHCCNSCGGKWSERRFFLFPAPFPSYSSCSPPPLPLSSFSPYPLLSCLLFFLSILFFFSFPPPLLLVLSSYTS